MYYSGPQLLSFQDDTFLPFPWRHQHTGEEEGEAEMGPFSPAPSTPGRETGQRGHSPPPLLTISLSPLFLWRSWAASHGLEVSHLRSVPVFYLLSSPFSYSFFFFFSAALAKRQRNSTSPWCCLFFLRGEFSFLLPPQDILESEGLEDEDPFPLFLLPSSLSGCYASLLFFFFFFPRMRLIILSRISMPAE